jgi:gag-polyprotein putative aspartyl protease
MSKFSEELSQKLASLNSANGRLLITECAISSAFDPRTARGQLPEAKPFAALWDTGAPTSAISQRVVQECGLKPSGTVQVRNAGAIYDSEIFEISLELPQCVRFSRIPVVIARSVQLFDVIIGMDIMSTGDLTLRKVERGVAGRFIVRVDDKVAGEIALRSASSLADKSNA